MASSLPARCGTTRGTQADRKNKEGWGEMDKGKFTVLKADIDAQIREIENIYAKLEERRQ